MRYYAHIDHNNRLLGYYNDDLHDTIPTPNIELTYDQWQSCLDIRANKISDEGVGEVFDFRNTEEKEADVRLYRDHLLSTSVDPIVSNPLRWAEMTADKQAEWSAYRTALLDITDQAGFPTDIAWPTKPE